MTEAEAVQTLKACETAISLTRTAGPFREMVIQGNVSPLVATKRASALLTLGSGAPKISADGRITVEAAEEFAKVLLANNINFPGSSRFIDETLGV